MTETTISLSDALMELAKTQAQTRGLTLSTILSDAVEIGLSAQVKMLKPGDEGAARDPLFAAEFAFEDDLPPDLSERFNQYSTGIAVQDHERSERQ